MIVLVLLEVFWIGLGVDHGGDGLDEIVAVFKNLQTRGGIAKRPWESFHYFADHAPSHLPVIISGQEGEGLPRDPPRPGLFCSFSENILPALCSFLAGSAPFFPDC